MSVVSPNPLPAQPGLHLRGMGRPLPLSQIVRFEADDNYTRIYLRGQTAPLLYAYTLRAMCQRFPFMARVSKSTAINPGYVQAIARRGVLLADHQLIRLSRYHLKRLPGELQRARQLAGF